VHGLGTVMFGPVTDEMVALTWFTYTLLAFVLLN
jgi:hypothetical protein